MSGPEAESRQIAHKLDSLREKHLQGLPLAQPGDVNMDRHPAKYFEADRRDDYIEAKKAVTADANKYGLGTVVNVGNKDIQYLLDQRTKEEKFNFDRWKYTTYQPGSDPIRIRYFEKIDPSFFK